MNISPVSNVSLLPGSPQVPNQKQQKPNASETPTDTVHLSPAAVAHLKGADADGDGDGH